MSVSDTFRLLLKSLNLGYYPCKKQEINDKIVKFPNGKKFRIKEDNDDLLQEREEMLYLMRDKKSPWYIEYEWSNEAQEIREKFIKNPKLIDIQNIETYFKSLRLSNRNIRQVDKDLLKFFNLNELILSVNWIENCDSANLPDSLRLLDLSGNQINDLGSLEHRPMIHLEHLGLAYNHLHDLSEYLSPNNWSSLLSLDLSGNHIVNLKELVIYKLKLLPKLRNLVLYANPICLIPSYRGFIIDTLSELNVFDDQSISKDERFKYFNMKSQPDLIKNEAQITITVSNLANLYMPYEMKYPDQQTDYPINVFKYFIRFYFVDDVEFESEKVFKNTPQLVTPDNPYEERIEGKTFEDYKDLVKDRFTKQKAYKTRILETHQFDFHDNIQFDDKGIIKLKHKSLKSLRDFMLHGMQMEIIEKKTLYDQPKDHLSEMASSTQIKDKKKDAGKKESSAVGSKLDAKSTKDTKKTPGGDLKKKKDISSLLANLEVVSVEERKVAKFHLDLASILDCNHFKLEKKFTQILEIPEYVINEFNEQSDPKSKDKKGKDKKEAARKSAKGPTNDPKAKRKTNESKNELSMDEEPVLTAQTLEMNMKFEVLNFSSADEFFSHFKNDIK